MSSYVRSPPETVPIQYPFCRGVEALELPGGWLQRWVLAGGGNDSAVHDRDFETTARDTTGRYPHPPEQVTGATLLSTISDLHSDLDMLT